MLPVSWQIDQSLEEHWERGRQWGTEESSPQIDLPCKTQRVTKKKKKRNKPSANRWKKVILVLSIESEARKANSKKNR